MSIETQTSFSQRGAWYRLLPTLLLVVLALNSVPAAQALPPPTPANAHINGTDCDLIDAITAANTNTATGLCAAGTPGADTIELLDNVTLTAVEDSSGAGAVGLPMINSDITINGNGFTIGRDPGAPQFRIIWVNDHNTLIVNNATIAGGFVTNFSGGGIVNRGLLAFNGSTLTGNSASSGAGLNNNSGIATFSNSTVSGNFATSQGGGITNSGTLTVTNSTISDNVANTNLGGGISNRFLATLTLEQSLVSGNSAGIGGNEIYNQPGFCQGPDETDCVPGGAVVADNTNLFGHSGQSTAQALINFTPGSSDITATSDGTTPTTLSSILDTTLQDNGGGTATHALVAGSPALDAAPSGPAADQRGVARPQGTAFDIGAYELEIASNEPPVANDDSVTTDEDTPITFNVLANDTDVDGNLDASSVSVVSGASNGTLTDNGSGNFTYSPNANFFGSDSFTYEVCDSDDVCDSAVASITVNPVNDAPDCSSITPSISELWPPNHQFVPITFNGATDIEGDALTMSVTSIFQDELVNGTGDGNTSPDGQGVGTSTAEVRAERQGGGNGRYYHITISASDGNGGNCSATTQVSVPKNQGKKGAAVDDGPLYNSTQP